MPRAAARFSLSDALLNAFEINERIRDGHHPGQDAMRPRRGLWPAAEGDVRYVGMGDPLNFHPHAQSGPAL